jgi:hypothetical protein
MSTPSGYGTDSRKQAMGAAKINLEKNREKLQTNIIRCIESNNNCRDLEQLGLIAIDESLLVTSGDLANIGAIGGLGGGEVVQKCGDYVTGVHGESGWILDRAGTVCSDGKRLPQLGKNQSTAFEARCPAGQVVVGIQGRREPYKKTTAVGSLVLECLPLDKVRANDQNVTEVVAFSGEESRDIKRRCDPGQAAKEVVFRAGFWIDSISLNCVKVY